MPNTPIHDVAIVGGGVVGAATAAELARRGARAVLLERHAPGHVHGSSHGDGRIFRLTYEDPLYVAMARRAAELWRGLEARCGERLLEPSGNWECGPAESPILAELVGVLERLELPFERWTAAESRRRMPHFVLPDASIAIHQPDGGVLRADRAVGALWADASSPGADLHGADLHGAEMRVDAAVEHLDVGRDKVRLTGAWGSLEARTVIVAAGAWTAGLLAPLGVDLPLDVSREQVYYFAPRPGAAADGIDGSVGAMPTMIDYHDPAKPFYALPSVDGGGVKVGRHRGGKSIDPSALRFAEPPVFDAADQARVEDHVRAHLPWLEPKPIRRSTCLYVNTADYHFVLDRIQAPGVDGRVVVGGGFSGHGFKFAPVLGEILADLALGETPSFDLSGFRLDRFRDPASLRRRTGA